MEEYLEMYYEHYQKLSTQERQLFSKVCNKLLACNFMTSLKQQDEDDYYFIVGHLTLIKAYFRMIDYELVFDATNKVIFLQSHEASNRLNLKLNQSIVLLLLRLLYDEKMREVSLTNHIIISLGDLHEKLLTSGLKSRRLSKTELRQILAFFKKFHLVDLLGSDYSKDDTRLILYPTILYAVPMEEISQVYDRLQSYQKGDEQFEEISEGEVNQLASV